MFDKIHSYGYIILLQCGIAQAVKLYL